MSDYIIEISKSPVALEDRISEDLFYESLCGWIADYVDDHISESVRRDVIGSFCEAWAKSFPEYISVNAGAESITFKEGFNKAFAKATVKAVKDLVAKTDDNASLFDLTCKLKSLIGDPFGTYIYREDEGSYTEVAFLRDVLPGTYYFGGVVYYK